MKQKILIKFSACCEKCRTKALKTASMASGVTSVGLEGDDKDKLVVVGEGVDAACLIHKLRKKLSCADLLQVEEVKPPQKKPEEKKPEPVICCQGPPRCELVNLVYDPNPPPCTIM